MYLVVSALSFILLVVALVDIITHSESDVQHLPKLLWIVIVIIVPLAGSVIWFAVGRQHGAPIADGRFSAPRGRSGYGTRGSSNAGATVRQKTTEEQLADLDREIAFHEQEARIRQLEEQLKRQRDETDLA